MGQLLDKIPGQTNEHFISSPFIENFLGGSEAETSRL